MDYNPSHLLIDYLKKPQIKYERLSTKMKIIHWKMYVNMLDWITQIYGKCDQIRSKYMQSLMTRPHLKVIKIRKGFLFFSILSKNEQKISASVG